MKLLKLILPIILLCSLSAKAQEREIAKLNRLYEKEKYERCAEFAKECIREFRTASWPYDFAINAYLASIPDAERLSHEYLYLRKALRILERYPDTSNPSFILAYQELYTSAEAMKSNWKEANPRNVDRLNPVMDILHEMGAVPIAPEPEDLLVILSDENSIKIADSLRQILVNSAQTRAGWDSYLDNAKRGSGDFTKSVYKEVELFLPTDATEQSKVNGFKIVPKNSHPGDLIFFGSWMEDQYFVDLVGIVISNQKGNLKLAICLNGQVRFEDENAWNNQWKKRALFARDLITYNLQMASKP